MGEKMHGLLSGRCKTYIGLSGWSTKTWMEVVEKDCQTNCE